jgi:hypothetical protein
MLLDRLVQPLNQIRLRDLGRDAVAKAATNAPEL